MNFEPTGLNFKLWPIIPPNLRFSLHVQYVRMCRTLLPLIASYCQLVNGLWCDLTSETFPSFSVTYDSQWTDLYVKDLRGFSETTDMMIIGTCECLASPPLPYSANSVHTS